MSDRQEAGKSCAERQKRVAWERRRKTMNRAGTQEMKTHRPAGGGQVMTWCLAWKGGIAQRGERQKILR